MSNFTVKLEIMKAILNLVLLVSITGFSQEEVKLIETSTTAQSTTTTYTDGSSKSTSPSYSLKWRYKGESNWQNTGRRYNNIAVALNKYESSAALLQQTKNIDLYGKGSGWLIMAGGMTMAIIGFTTSKEIETINPNTGEPDTELKERTTLGWTGLGVCAAGFYIRYASVHISMKRFDQACEEYNKMAGKDSACANRLDFGVATSTFTPYPLMNFKLTF